MTWEDRLANRLGEVLALFSNGGRWPAITVHEEGQERTLPVTEDAQGIIVYGRDVLKEFRSRPKYDAEMGS